MDRPNENRSAATKAAERWKRRSKADDQEQQVEDLKAQIIATFRLQKGLANEAGSQQGKAGQWRQNVKDIWTAAFTDDPIHDFNADDDNSSF